MVARPSETPVLASSSMATEWRGRAFAMDIHAPQSIIGVPSSSRDQGLRSTSLDFISVDQLDEIWAGSSPTRVFERLFSDGKPMFTVDHDPVLGYRVWAPRHGRHLVSSDGRNISSAIPRRSGWWWQRLVLAQVLPIAATLQGVELLHASAVAFEGKAVAITAEAGAGKTSLAVHLLDLGAELVADDVVALEATAGNVMAHPGVGLVNIAPQQLEALGSRAAMLLPETLGRGDKCYVLGRLVDKALPLSAVYFLRRSKAYDQVSIVEAEPDPRLLLGSAFIAYVDADERLLTHLDLYSRIARGTTPFVIEAPLDLPAPELAKHLWAHGAEAW